MIVTFKSAACADTLYFGDVARRMLELVGKELTDQGIVTVDQLPEAIDRLKAAILADRAAHRRQVLEDERGVESDGAGSTRPCVSLTQRALPLLTLFERSLEENKPVVWGV